MPFFLSESDGTGMIPGGFGASNGAAMGGAALGAAGGAGYIINGGQIYSPMEMTSMDQGMSGHLGMMRDDISTYDSGMGLSEDFLNHYYSNVSGHILEST